LALRDCVMRTLEKNIARPARCSVDKADNDLSRAHLPGSERKTERTSKSEGPDGKD
jgi:hypothetical protein